MIHEYKKPKNFVNQKYLFVNGLFCLALADSYTIGYHSIRTDQRITGFCGGFENGNIQRFFGKNKLSATGAVA